MIDEVTIINSDSNEINFYNTTKKDLDNPNTSNNLKLIIIPYVDFELLDEEYLLKRMV